MAAPMTLPMECRQQQQQQVQHPPAWAGTFQRRWCLSGGWATTEIVDSVRARRWASFDMASPKMVSSRAVQITHAGATVKQKGRAVPFERSLVGNWLDKKEGPGRMTVLS